MFKVYINNQDFTQYVDKNRLSIVREIKDYHAEMELFVPISLLSYLEPSVNVQIKNGEKTIFGGIIYTVRFGRRVGEKREVTLTLETYNIYPARRTISGVIDLEPTDPENPELDQNTAGAMIERYIDLYLSEDGILKGNIGRGARLADTLEIYEWDTMSLKEIFDTLGDLTGDTWFIDMEKRLHFASEETQSVTHTGEDIDIREENHNYWDFEIEKTLENYMNKIFVRGNYPWDEIPAEYEDYDGKIKYVQENTEEIQRMAALNGDTGVWGKVVKDEKIEFLETAQRKAEIEFKKYGKMPIRIRVKTSLDIFKPGDKVSVELPTWKVSKDLFTVERVEIKFDENGDIVYILELINNELVGREGLTDVIAKQIRQGKEKVRDVGGGGGGGTTPPDYMIPRDNLVCWIDMQVLDNVNILEYEEESIIANVKDKINGDLSFKELGYWSTIKNPRLKSYNGYNWMSFDIIDENLFEGNLIQLKYEKIAGGTVFIVYNDRTPSHGNSLRTETEVHDRRGVIDYYTITKHILKFPGYSCPLGFPFSGVGGIYDYLVDVNTVYDWSSLYVNGVNVSIQDQGRIRNTPTVLCFSSIPEVSEFGNNTFGRNPEWEEKEEIFEEENTVTTIITRTAENPYFIGDIAEIIIYNVPLPQIQIDEINNYLMKKYNI